MASGDVPITSSTFGHAQPTKAKETTSNLRSHSLAEAESSTLGLDPKFLNASTPPFLQSSHSVDHLRDFTGQGESFLGNDSQGDSSRELERLLDVADHPVTGHQSKYLAGKGASSSDEILGRKSTPSSQEVVHRLVGLFTGGVCAPASLSPAAPPAPGSLLPPPTWLTTPLGGWGVTAQPQGRERHSTRKTFKQRGVCTRTCVVQTTLLFTVM